MQIEELAWSGIYHLVYFREKAYCSFDCLYMCCTFAYQKVNTCRNPCIVIFALVFFSG